MFIPEPLSYDHKMTLFSFFFKTTFNNSQILILCDFLFYLSNLSQFCLGTKIAVGT